MNVRMIPYAWHDGVPTFKDSEIMALYEQMQADGTAKASFHDGTVNSAAEFLQAMKGPENWLYVFLAEGAGAIGIGWINQVKFKSAAGHFCFFSSVWGRKDLSDIGNWGVQRLLRMTDRNGEYLFDMFWGLIPAENKIAVKFVEKAGGYFVGILPHGLWSERLQQTVDGILFYFIRDGGEYEGVYQGCH